MYHQQKVLPVINLVGQVIYVDQEEDWPKDRSPCGTPDVTGTSLEQPASRTTVCDLPFRNALIQYKVLPLIP